VKLDKTNADIVHLFDLGEYTREGDNEVKLTVDGKINSLYQIVGRYYLPWKFVAKPPSPELDLTVKYDRTQLKQNGMVTANVEVTYHDSTPTYMVIVDVGIPPGFTVNTEDLDMCVSRNTIERFDLTGRHIIIYLGQITNESPIAFSYRLKAKFPIRAMTPRSMAYEYYNPDAKAVAKPVEMLVSQ